MHSNFSMPLVFEDYKSQIGIYSLLIYTEKSILIIILPRLTSTIMDSR